MDRVVGGYLADDDVVCSEVGVKEGQDRGFEGHDRAVLVHCDQISEVVV